MWLITLLLACKLGEAPVKDTDGAPDTDGGKAAAKVAEEVKQASDKVDAMIEQVKQAEPAIAPVEAAPVAPPPAPPKP
jgi:hypothetical protein